MKIMTFLRLSCSTKSCRPTHPPQLTFQSRPKELISHHLLAEDNSQESINAPSVTNALSITLSSSNTGESTAGYSPTTALSVGELSEQPLCWLATGSANVKMLRIFVSNAGTVFRPRWINSDTTARKGAATTTADNAGRAFQSPAA